MPVEASRDYGKYLGGLISGMNSNSCRTTVDTTRSQRESNSAPSENEARSAGYAELLQMRPTRQCPAKKDRSRSAKGCYAHGMDQ